MITTIATGDSFYFNQLLVMLTSIKINSPGHRVDACLIDCSKAQVDRLIKSFPEFNFENRKIKRIDKRGISFILLRIKLIQEHFEKYKEQVAWIDTDVIVRKPLGSFLDIKPEQLKILFRGKKAPEKVRFNAGVLNFGCSDETKALVDTWYNLLSKNMVWGMGQLELYRAYKKHEERVELIELPEAFNDLGDSTNNNSFNTTSAIWHCKKHHFNNPKFQKEFKYYLKRVK